MTLGHLPSTVDVSADRQHDSTVADDDDFVLLCSRHDPLDGWYGTPRHIDKRFPAFRTPGPTRSLVIRGIGEQRGVGLTREHAKTLLPQFGFQLDSKANGPCDDLRCLMRPPVRTGNDPLRCMAMPDAFRCILCLPVTDFGEGYFRALCEGAVAVALALTMPHQDQTDHFTSRDIALPACRNLCVRLRRARVRQSG